jgi:hypothetical protein
MIRNLIALGGGVRGPYTATMSEQVWVALIAAGAAIVASIGAQIIGAFVSHTQQKRRLDLEERKLFADIRRVAFVSYLQTRNGFADDIWELYVKSDEFHTGLDSPQIRERADAHLSQLEPLRNEISLLAPDVATKFEVESRSELDLALAGLFGEDELISNGAATVRWLAKFNLTTSEIEKAMRKSLGIEDREVSARPNEQPMTRNPKQPGPSRT